MSNNVTDLVGYQFDPVKKGWLAAFFIGTYQANDPKPTGHYELLSLSEIKAREEAALKNNDRDAAFEFDTAETAIEDTIAGNRASPDDLPGDFKARLYSSHQDELFKVIDPVADVDWTEFQIAQKTAQVKAELVPAGTKVETIMANGLVETTKTAGTDGGYRVTALTGEQYLVDRAKFEKLYDPVGTEGIYAPKPDPRKVIDLDKNVAFTAPWGEEMRIRSGGVLVHGGPKDVYGIQPAEFKASYSFG